MPDLIRNVHVGVPVAPLRSWKSYVRWFRKRPLVRPWALSAPIFVLIICLPLMRPLRHPDPEKVSDDEQARLATIQAVVEHHTLEIQRTSFFATRDVICVKGKDGQPRWYSDQSPVMAVLLSGPYWVMHWQGLSFDRNPVIAEYLLTLLGVTLPIAFAAGLLYRMARMFELRRPVRAALALAVVIGSGWISYATVLSGGAAAAALVVMGAAALVQASFSVRRAASLAWVATGGLCLALAATYELAALAFLVFLILVVAGYRWSRGVRLAAASAYVAAAMVPLLLYAALNRSVTGDLRPGFLHAESAFHADTPVPSNRSPSLSRWSDDEDEPPTFWHSTWRDFVSFLRAFVGGHGLVTHFPVLLFGLLGVGTVLRRHWPGTTKGMVCATVLAALAIMVGYTLQHADWNDAMFANRWFLVFLPLSLFWAGAWLRRPHHTGTWIVAASLWGFSALIALVGATDPQPRQGYDQKYSYSAAGAFMNLVNPPKPQPTRAIVAGE